jgi:putative peptidoglycan lipid II flippase
VIKPVLALLTDFDTRTLDLIYKLFLETSPLLILLVWTSVLAGTLNAHEKFSYPALSPALRSVVNLVVIFTFKNALGVHAIAVGYVLGEIARLGILVAIIKNLRLFNLRLSFRLDIKLREFFKKASYQTIGMTALGLNPLINKTMASWLGEGSVSVLYYADMLYMVPVMLISAGLMVTILSHWSRRFYESGEDKLHQDIKKIIKIVGLISLIITALLIFFYKPITKLAFGRGAFTEAWISEVGGVWVCYLFGFAPYILAQIYVQGHLVLRNTKVLMLCAFGMNAMNILFNYFLMKLFNVKGIALATSIIYVLSYVFLSSMFKKRIKNA